MTATAVSLAHPSKPDSRNSKRALSPARQRLLVILQSLNFGHIEQLQVRAGEPVLDPMPVCFREIKFGGENGCRPEARLDDFVLKDQQVGLIQLLDEIGDGAVSVLTIKHGLPFSAEYPG